MHFHSKERLIRTRALSLQVAHVLFGHVFEPFSTPEDGAVFLFLTILMGWDPVDFWDQMTNAAEPWAFYICT